MTLDEIVAEKQGFAEKYLLAAGCSYDLIDLMKACIKWSAVEAWHQGKIDYIKDDLSGVLTEIKKDI